MNDLEINNYRLLNFILSLIKLCKYSKILYLIGGKYKLFLVKGNFQAFKGIPHNIFIAKATKENAKQHSYSV